ncbi:MAG: c-type cytochrome [Lewinellaceae bacterium]|nr:c-type cytochrome [Lewinellaceae bacterium]
MTRIFTTFVLIAALASCTGNGTSGGPEEQTDSAAVNDIAMNPDYEPGLALVVSSDCYNCHKVDEEMIGPPYRKIAEKYAGADEATLAALAEKIRTGGSGNWVVDTMMTPHPTVSEEDAMKIVKYIILLSQEKK